MATVVAISDIHGNLISVPECDILLIAGDICPTMWAAPQAQWLRGPFADWLNRIPAKEVVGVAGNHDWIFQQGPELVTGLRWHYLRDEAIKLFGLTIYGT